MKKSSFLLLFFLLTMTVHQYAVAGQAVNCHCFRNREFNPEDRFAADDYLLTTVFNSLTAGYFAVEKRNIVMLKMKGGAHNDDLLIALYIARHAQIEVDDLLDMKKNSAWRKVLEKIRINESFSNDSVYRMIMEDVPETQTADRITAKMLSELFKIPAVDLDKMIQQGLTWRQLSLALTLADYTGTDLQSIASLRYKQKLSWSEIAHNFGLEPSQAGKIAEKMSRIIR